MGQAEWPLTSNHSWSEAVRAKMSSWLCHISCDRLQPPGALACCWPTKRPKRQLSLGNLEVNEPERVSSTTVGWWTRRKRCTFLTSHRSAASQSRCYMLIWWLACSGGVIYYQKKTKSHGQMWFLQYGRQVEEVFVYRSIKLAEMHTCFPRGCVGVVLRSTSPQGKINKATPPPNCIFF